MICARLCRGWGSHCYLVLCVRIVLRTRSLASSSDDLDAQARRRRRQRTLGSREAPRLLDGVYSVRCAMTLWKTLSACETGVIHFPKVQRELEIYGSPGCSAHVGLVCTSRISLRVE